MLDPPVRVTIKGAAEPVPARRLHEMASNRTLVGRRESTLVGRHREMEAIAGMLDEAIHGQGRVVGLTGPAGIGKSRVCRELVKIAKSLGVETFSTFCESHAAEIPFHVVARLLRNFLRIEELDHQAARSALRTQLTAADPEDLLLLDDLLGIRDPTTPGPNISADARRRRLAALVNSAALARNAPAVYIIEDVHWIDEASESMLADLVTVLVRTPSMVVITYRSEYNGALSRPPGVRCFSLAPLDDSAASAMTAELVGLHPSLSELAAHIIERSAGNPFYVQEIVREFAERQVIVGPRGAYRWQRELADVSVPPTLQATIGARIDRLTVPAKRTLNAAAVIGSRFGADLLAIVLGEVDESEQVALAELIHSELIDQVMFTPRAEYAFRHPLVQTVAYESQLRPARAQLHRRLAAAVERANATATDENAAMIAAHLEAAGDLRDAYGWHMRAGTWFTNRDINAARTSWQRARRLADQLPVDEPHRNSMRIAPRALLRGSAWRAGGSIADTGFDELRDLCTNAETQVPLAMGMAGLLSGLTIHGRVREALRLTSEYVQLLESIGEPTLTVGLLYPVIHTKYEAAEMTEALTLSQRVIDLANGDPTKGNLLTGSPLAFAMAMRASARCALGQRNWKDDFDEAIQVSRVDPTTYVSIVMFKYVFGILAGALRADAAAMHDSAEALATAQRCSEDFALHIAQVARGVTLVSGGRSDRACGFELLTEAWDAAMAERFVLTWVPIIDLHTAMDRIRREDLDGAIELARHVIAAQFETGSTLHLGAATNVLVESLLRRGWPADLDEAHAAIDTLQAVPTDPGFVLYELPLLRMRALLARASNDAGGYRTCADRYLAMARALEFNGHLMTARAME